MHSLACQFNLKEKKCLQEVCPSEGNVSEWAPQMDVLEEWLLFELRANRFTSPSIKQYPLSCFKARGSVSRNNVWPDRNGNEGEGVVLKF